MFLAVVAPIAAFVLASAAIALFPWLRAQVEHVGLVWTLHGPPSGPWPTSSAGGALAWDTEPFPDGPQRELLDDVSLELRARGPRIWRTGNLVANATIIGLTRRGWPCCSATSCSRCSIRELSAVYAHEIGHAVRGHGDLPAWTAGFFLIGDLAVARTLEGSSSPPGSPSAPPSPGSGS